MQNVSADSSPLGPRMLQRLDHPLMACLYRKIQNHVIGLENTTLNLSLNAFLTLIRMTVQKNLHVVHIGPHFDASFEIHFDKVGPFYFRDLTSEPWPQQNWSF